ncbi:alpha/beta fold hydrolase [Kribbella sp. NPDC049584]|uniref:alpha/beta fold hydrolase n=1 Tax=Kribbella sp. NPDC049584 TaxID=3154833 RepID=UPI0034165267
MTYQYAELAGARIAYRASGSGPALVLMKNNRRPLDYPVADMLAQRFRVLQIHPVGFGASDRPDDYDFGSIGDQVLTVLDRDGIDQFAIWGFSQPACMSADRRPVNGSRDRARYGWSPTDRLPDRRRDAADGA